MATFGNSSTPGSGYFFDDTGNSQFASKFSGFPGGIITEIHVYAAGDGGSCNMDLGVWSTSGLLAHSGTYFQTFAGSRSIGGQTWQVKTGLNTYVAPQDVYIGYWTDGGVVWTYDSSSGDTHYTRGLSSIGTGAQGGSTEGSGRLGAYIVYTPLSAPTVTSVSPGDAPRGANISLVGTSFSLTTGVTVGGVSASYTVNSDTSLTVTIPGGAPYGTQTVTVTNAAGSGSNSVYVVAPPNITGISPTVAPSGANVTISGSGFNYTSSVTFGGVGASFTVNSDSSITATVPSGIGGVVTVVVTNPAGNSSSSMTAGQIWTNPSGGVAAIKAVYTNAGAGVVQAVGVWTNSGSGNKRIW